MISGGARAGNSGSQIDRLRVSINGAFHALFSATLTADRTYTLPDSSFALAGTAANTFTGINQFTNANAVGLGSTAPTAGNGFLQLTSGVTKANGIAFGTDSFLFRSSANQITVNSSLYVQSASGNGVNDNFGMLQLYNSQVGGAGGDSASITFKNQYGTGQYFQWDNFGMRIGSRITTGGAGVMYLTTGNDQAVCILNAAGECAFNSTNTAATAGNGLLQIATGATKATGIAWGTDTFLYRDAANSLTTDGDLRLSTLGKGLRIKEGSNAKMGTATLVAGTVTVSTTAVTANSRIFVSHMNSSGTRGSAAVTTVTAGTSFAITSTSGTDTSLVAWVIIEPS